MTPYSSERTQLRMYDPIITAQKSHIDLPESSEYVCLAQNVERKLYGVGSKALITLVDSREPRVTKKISTACMHHNIRSISFKDEVCSVGTGSGKVLFYDLRKMEFFRTVQPVRGCAYLDCSEGYTVNFLPLML